MTNRQFSRESDDDSLRSPIALRFEVASLTAQLVHVAACLRRAEEERDDIAAVLDRVRSRFHFLAASVPHIMWSALADGWPDYYNRHWWDYTGLPLGRADWTWRDVLHPDDVDRCFTVWSRGVATGKPFDFDCRLRRAADAIYRWHHVQSVPMRDDEGNVEIWVGSAVDSDDAIKAVEALIAANNELEARVTERTAELARLNTSLRAEIDERRRIETALRSSLARQEEVEIRLATALQERTEALRVVEYQALHDSLTGLPNRLLLADRVDRAMRDATRRGTTFALLILDLDGFKIVNDRFGHHVGDGLLREVARRLQSTLRDIDTVARLGGDEFAVVLPMSNEDGARGVAQKLVNAIQEPICVEGWSIQVVPSVGIARFPHDGDSQDLLMRHADTAMYRAKRDETRVAVYAHDPRQDS